MKKTLLSLILLLFTLTSLSAFVFKIKRDKADPWQNLKIGDKFTISKTTTDTETTFDFTGLGIDDSMLDNVSIKAVYYKDNNTETSESIDMFLYNHAKLGFTWYLADDVDIISKVENITTSYYKQTIKHTDENREILNAPIGRVSIVLSYYPEGRKHVFNVYNYTLKGLNNGTGEIEVVGYMAMSPHNGTSTDMGGDYSYASPIKTQEKKIERNTNDPLQNLKIGDKLTIRKTSTETETTFDFTGLGLDDSMVDKIDLEVDYFDDNDTEVYDTFSLYIKPKEKDSSFEWSFHFAKYNVFFDNIKKITSSYFKQTLKHTDENKGFLTSNIIKVHLSLKYYPQGEVYFDHYFEYKFKALNNGSGEIEVVGYEISMPNEIDETAGDWI